LEPNLYEAWLGLGQYEYYCAHISGIVRFVLSLPGDEKEGIRLLEGCSKHPNFASISARQCLARIYTEERPDFEKALPLVIELVSRYPRNYDFIKYALEEARGLGLERPEARQLLEGICAEWDKGWRPPSGITLDINAVRQDLKQASQETSQGAGVAP
jgi:hypothetical protein